MGLSQRSAAEAARAAGPRGGAAAERVRGSASQRTDASGPDNPQISAIVTTHPEYGLEGLTAFVYFWSLKNALHQFAFF